MATRQNFSEQQRQSAFAANAVAKLFVECIVAPKFSDAAVEILGRKKNLRVLEGRARWPGRALDYKRVRGGLLVQERPPATIDDSAWRVVTKRHPTDEEHRDLLFAWRAVASVKSNAIVLARDGATIGIGAGQMSRVDAAFIDGVWIGINRSNEHSERVVGLGRKFVGRTIHVPAHALPSAFVTGPPSPATAARTVGTCPDSSTAATSSAWLIWPPLRAIDRRRTRHDVETNGIRQNSSRAARPRLKCINSL
jgi:hypothetical protein